MASLVFIDTNILLDFYRVRGKRNALSILERIDENHDKIITCRQIEIEFKKNRQGVILESAGALKLPDFNSLTLPAILAEKQAAAGIEKRKREIKQRIESLRKSMDSLMKHPSRNDPVFQVAQRLFKSRSSLNLTHANPINVQIGERAAERFKLGHPPRKDKNPTMGDSINWEWIVECAKEKSRDVVLVSRDGDYGNSDIGLVNDWLLTEFKERCGKKLNLTLTPLLSEGFKSARIAVSKKEVAAETAQLAQIFVSDVFPSYVKGISEGLRQLYGGDTITNLYKQALAEAIPKINLGQIAFPTVAEAMSKVAFPSAFSSLPNLSKESKETDE